MKATQALLGVAAALVLAAPELRIHAGQARSDSPEARAQAKTGSWAKVRFSELMGKEVSNAEGEDLGSVSDAIVDLSNGRVRYAIVEFSGIAGLSEKLFAYPLSAFRIGKDDSNLVLNVERSQLAGAEGFDRDRFPPGHDPYWARAERAQGGGASAGAGGAPGRIEPPEFVRASRVLGSEVRDTRRDDEAEVKDLIVDLRSGTVQQLVLDNGGGRDLRLPIEKLSAAGRENDLRLKADLPGVPK